MIPVPEGQKPREWQIAAFRALGAAVRAGVYRPFVQACTGAGKGTFLAGLAAYFAGRRCRVMIRVHRRELIDDLADRVRRLGVPCGIVQGDRRQWLSDVVVVSVQTIALCVDKIPQYDVVITDEAHHAPAPTYRKTLQHIEKLQKASGRRGGRVLHIGLSANDFRADGKGGTVGLSEDFDATIFRYPVPDAIADGVLVPPVGLKIETDCTVADVARTRSGDFDESELAAAVNVAARNDLIATKYREHAAGRHALAFCVDVQHAHDLTAAMRSQGVAAHAVWGAMPDRQRADIIGRFKAGDPSVQVLCSRDLLFEGFDAPVCSAILQARPTQSAVIALQMPGRGLRLHPGKSDCLVLSFTDRGLELTVDVEQALTEGDDEQTSRDGPRPLEVGDLVQHRRQDFGTGAVVEAGDVLCRVRWPADGDRQHGRVELRLAREDETDVAIDLRITGVTEYALELLPGDRPAAAIGWYFDGDVWSAEARVTDDRTVVAWMRRLASGAWSVWGVTLEQQTRQHRARKIAEDRDLLRARMAGRAWLLSRGGRVSDWTSAWRSQRATDRQIGGLRAMGLARDLSGLTKGEASCLLAALRARKVIRSEMRRLRQRHAGGRRSGPTAAQIAGLRKRADDAGAALNLRVEQALRARGYLTAAGDLTDAGRAVLA
jgi:superfamily II DNA or RNA helicase